MQKSLIEEQIIMPAMAISKARRGQKSDFFELTESDVPKRGGISQEVTIGDKCPRNFCEP
jgi:hypothetical protein